MKLIRKTLIHSAPGRRPSTMRKLVTISLMATLALGASKRLTYAVVRVDPSNLRWSSGTRSSCAGPLLGRYYAGEKVYIRKGYFHNSSNPTRKGDPGTVKGLSEGRDKLLVTFGNGGDLELTPFDILPRVFVSYVGPNPRSRIIPQGAWISEVNGQTEYCSELVEFVNQFIKTSMVGDNFHKAVNYWMQSKGLSKSLTITFCAEESAFRQMSMDNSMKQIMANLDVNKLEQIGAGAFGKVYKVNDYALKVINGSLDDKIRQEIEIGQRNESQFLLKTTYATNNGNHYFLSKYIAGPELYELLKADVISKKQRLKLSYVQFIAACVVEAFDALHSRGIVYRDLKPENLMLDKNGYIITIDYGLSKVVGENKCWESVGTPEYIAPELIRNGNEQLPPYNGRDADLWTLGVLIYELAFGYPPFGTYNRKNPETVTSLYTRIKSYNDKRHVFNVKLTDEQFDDAEQVTALQQLISALLKNNPSERLGSKTKSMEVIRQHAFFKGLDWDRLKRRDLPGLPEEAINYKPHRGQCC